MPPWMEAILTVGIAIALCVGWDIWGRPLPAALRAQSPEEPPRVERTEVPMLHMDGTPTAPEPVLLTEPLLVATAAGLGIAGLGAVGALLLARRGEGSASR